MVLLDTNQDETTRPENEAAPRSSELRRGRKTKKGSPSTTEDDDSRKGGPGSRQDPRIPSFRLKELKNLVDFWREQPDLVKVEHPNGLGNGLECALEERVFRVALPCLVALKITPNGNGEPGPGDITAFAVRYCPTYYASKGGADHFEAMNADYHQNLVPKPRGLKADHAARILGLTLAVRTALKIKTIGAVDRSAIQRRRDRLKAWRTYSAQKRRKADMVEWAKSNARTEPWKAFGISRRTWYNRGWANGIS
jgi:hypothetical protein